LRARRERGTDRHPFWLWDEQLDERLELWGTRAILAAIGEHRVSELVDYDGQRRRFHGDAFDRVQGREVRHVTKRVVGSRQKPALRRVATDEHSHIVEVERRSDDAGVHAPLADPEPSQGLRLDRACGGGVRSDCRTHLPDSARIQLDPEQRPIESDHRYTQSRGLAPNRVEPRIAHLARKALISESRSDRGLCVGCQSRQPTPPGGADVSEHGIENYRTLRSQT
jgi:hypothetical protein